jgi:hypothetical protein
MDEGVTAVACGSVRTTPQNAISCPILRPNGSFDRFRVFDKGEVLILAA